MNFEQKLEKRLAHLEGLILARLTRIEQVYEGRIAHLEAEIQRLAWRERRTDREVERIERRLKPHHYPATTAVTVKPA